MFLEGLFGNVLAGLVTVVVVAAVVEKVLSEISFANEHYDILNCSNYYEHSLDTSHFDPTKDYLTNKTQRLYLA